MALSVDWEASTPHSIGSTGWLSCGLATEGASCLFGADQLESDLLFGTFLVAELFLKLSSGALTLLGAPVESTVAAGHRYAVLFR